MLYEERCVFFRGQRLLWRHSLASCPRRGKALLAEPGACLCQGTVVVRRFNAQGAVTLNELQVVGCVGIPAALQLPTCSHPLYTILTNHLQEVQARFAPFFLTLLHEAFIEQGCHPI